MPPKPCGFLPFDEAPTELIRKFKPLGEYLEQQLGMPVKFTPVSDYAAVVESLASDRLDLAWLGGFTFVQTRLKTGDAIPLVQREQDEQFTSKFITADPEVKSLADLKGKTFAFGSVSSTSGSLMPRYFMLKDGIEPEQYFKRIAYSGAHDATAAWVEAGEGRRRRAQRLGLGQAGRGRQGRYRQGASDLHHPALLRLQLDGAWQPRSGAGREDQGSVPRPRSGQTGAQGDPRSAGRQPLHRDKPGTMPASRKPRAQPACSSDAIAASPMNSLQTEQIPGHVGTQGRRR